MADSLSILNAIRSVAGSDYQARIPEAVRENIAEVGNTILDYTPATNLFMTELINRIGRTIVERMDSVEDIYAVFGEESLSKGDTIQKIFIDIPSAKAFVGTSTQNPATMLAVEKGTIHVEYTRVDRRMFYKRTISVEELKEAFVSVNALDDFIRAIIDSMETALGYDKYIMVTNTLAEHCKYVHECAVQGTSGKAKEVRELLVPSTVAVYNSETGKMEWDTVGAKVFLKLLRVVSGNLKYPHKLGYAKFVEGEIDTDVESVIEAQKTSREKQVLGLEVETLATIDVDALATLFNLSKADLQTRVIELQDGALGEYEDSDDKAYHIGGFLCNKEAVSRGTSFEINDSFKNPEGQYVNFWKHFWGWLAISKFKDFVPILFEVKAVESVSESEGE